MDDVPRWERGRVILGSAVRDMDLTRQLRLDLELMQGMRRDDPANEIIMGHARGLSEELSSMRMLRDELREAARRDIEEMEAMMRRATGEAG